MRIVLLGATGFVGRSAAACLAAHPEVAELLLVDYDIRAAKKFARSLSPKCRWAMSDVGREADLGRLLIGIDGVASAVGPCAEYERRILLTCAASGIPAASIGDGTLSPEEAREIDEAFRRRGIPAVSGCGLLPGWTELLRSHFLPGGGAAGPETADPDSRRFLFCSPGRFGGYAFFRRLVREGGDPALAPDGAPPGEYVRAGGGWLLGVPSGRPASLFRRLSGPSLPGTVGRELSAAALFWLRRFLAGEGALPSAAAGAFDPSPDAPCRAVVIDPRGMLPGALLGETAVRLARSRDEKPGLPALPEVIGRADAERIAASCGGRIVVG